VWTSTGYVRVSRNLWTTLRATLHLWTRARRKAAWNQSFRRSTSANLILLLSNRLARRGQFRPTAAAQISPSCAAFPLRPDGGRKDSKGSRVVEKECASRSFFLVTVT